MIVKSIEVYTYYFSWTLTFRVGIALVKSIVVKKPLELLYSEVVPSYHLLSSRRAAVAKN